MPLNVRRVVTGHDERSRAIVAIDELCSNMISRRAQHASCVIWSTGTFPADNADPQDGTVFRVVQYDPGVAPRNHRAESIDYAVVLSGEIDMELDGSAVHLRAGDVLVQRGTMHNWVNRGTQPCVIAFVLVAAKPMETLGAVG
jgi:quercetin dioxygenase-like cupin family protein